jgi:hypothetical protein
VESTVFDKFLQDEERPSLTRRLLNAIAKPLFSDRFVRTQDASLDPEEPTRHRRSESAIITKALNRSAVSPAFLGTPIGR